MDLKIKKLHPDAIVPEFAYDSDAGMDLFSIEEYVVKPGEVVIVKTGLSMEIPEGYVALVWDKSSMAAKHYIKTIAGVMDAGYRGEYCISLINLGQREYKIEKGDKFAQLLIQKVEHPEIKIVEELSNSERGGGGFGSTGKNYSEISNQKVLLSNIEDAGMKEYGYKGIFIAFEGLDGSGSSTQVDLLAKNLRKAGRTASTTKEPTNNLIGGLIRGVLTKEWSISPEGLQLLYAADRSHHLTREIIPKLEKGEVVISDRYLFSSIAFGSIACEKNWLKEINKYFVLPDITFFIKVPPKVCIDRIGKRGNNFELFEEEKKLEETLKTYEELAEDSNNGFVIIDGEKKIEDIEKEILEIVTQKFSVSDPALTEEDSFSSQKARW